MLFLLAVAAIEVYGVILAGWSSNNKYSLLGGLRASSQVISYELGMGLAIIAVILMSATLRLQGVVAHQGAFHTVTVPWEKGTYTFVEHSASSGFWDWHFLSLFPFGLIAAIVYMISMIAETNRAPFDLPEAETELVAGFHTEYSAFKFGMFFMAEYANVWVVSWVCITLFFGGYLAPWGPLSQIPAQFWGWDIAGGITPPVLNFLNHFVIPTVWLVLKLFLLIAFFITVRATLPRLRYDMLMQLGWKALLPVALVNVALIALSLAFQSVWGSWAHWLAVLIGVGIAGLAFLAKKGQYEVAAKSTALTTVSPIRRESTLVSVPANASGEAE
jgi:NADH-quinone oxidoreductase subunit H